MGRSTRGRVSRQADSQGFALAVGLIGVGVSASFTDSVTAKENINVGTFSCGITTATDGATYGAVDGLGYAHSVSYTAPTIESSAPGSAPFSFTVKNTGSIPDVLTVATSAVTTPPWSIIGAPFAPVPLAAGDSHPYNTGVSWTTLDNSQLNAHGSVTWTVSCGEVQAPTVTFSSVLDPTSRGGDDLYVARVDNTINGSGWAPGPVAVTVAMQYGASGTFVLSTWFPIGADPSGNILISGTIGTNGFLGANTWQDDCSNGAVVQHGTQVVTVTATQGALTATGTGSAPCP